MGEDLSTKIVKNITPSYNEETDNVRKQMTKAKGNTYADTPDKIVKNIV